MQSRATSYTDLLPPSLQGQLQHDFELRSGRWARGPARPPPCPRLRWTDLLGPISSTRRTPRWAHPSEHQATDGSSWSDKLMLAGCRPAAACFTAAAAAFAASTLAAAVFIAAAAALAAANLAAAAIRWQR